MPYILSHNLINENGVTVTVENTTTSPSSTLTDLTDREKIRSPQLEDAYEFILFGNKLRVTIDNIPAVFQRVGIVSILNTDDPFTIVESIICYNGPKQISTTSISRNNGNHQHAQNLIRNNCYLLEGGNSGINKVEINFRALGPTLIHKIGGIYIGEYINLSIEPNVKKSGVSDQKPDRTKGGQFYYSTPVVLKTLALKITKVQSQDYDKFDKLIVDHGTTQPIMIVNDIIQTQTIYCTFQNIPVFEIVKAKDKDGEWIHNSTIKVIENR